MISVACVGQPNFQDKPKSKDKGKKKISVQKGSMMYRVITVCLLVSSLLSFAVLLL